MKTFSVDAFQSLTHQIMRRTRIGMQRYHIPGVSVGLMVKSQTWMRGFGVTNVENPLPVTENTLFQIGSITKTVTAMAAVRLAEKGQLELDAPVRRYLPKLTLADEDTAARVTVRHLFQHTAGWLGDYFDDTGPGDDALAKVVERMASLPQETPLGSVWSYNNAAFYLAARVLEVVTGKTYEVLAQELVLGPLGMKQACFFAQDAITYRTAAGHDAVFEDGHAPVVLRPWGIGRCANAVGGLNVHMVDMLRYARFQMENGDDTGVSESGERLLTPEGLALLHTPSIQGANGEFTGLSWFVRDADGYRKSIRLIRHGGATNGQMATLIIAPEEHFALCILTNSDRGSELYAPLTRWILQEVLEISGELPKAKRVSGRILGEVSGHYTAAANDLVLSAKDGKLILAQINKGGFPTPDSPPSPNPPPVRLAFYDHDRIIVIDEPGKGTLGEFLRSPDGGIQFFRIGGRVHRRIAAQVSS